MAIMIDAKPFFFVGKPTRSTERVKHHKNRKELILNHNIELKRRKKVHILLQGSSGVDVRIQQYDQSGRDRKKFKLGLKLTRTAETNANRNYYENFAVKQC